MRAFNAPEIELEPVRSGDFIGSLDENSPVNFYNIKINPHGNGTHTESCLHIAKEGDTINKTLKISHFISRLISVEPCIKENGDRIIDRESMCLSADELSQVGALIIRTLPNDESKREFDYTGTNPCYLDPELAFFLSEHIDHLLIDLPSVDREEDGGKLLAHNAFWQTAKKLCKNKTITELIYVPEQLEDGLYLLDLQTIPLEMDASPSRPVLYKLVEA